MIKFCTTNTYLLTLMGLILFGFFQSELINAQTVDAHINGVTAYQIKNQYDKIVGWSVYVEFDKNFDATNQIDLLNDNKPSNFRLININDTTSVPVSEVKFVIVPGTTDNRIKLFIPSPESLNMDGLYHLYALNIHFKGQPSKNVLQHAIEIKVNNVGITEKPEIDKTSSPNTNPRLNINPQEEPKPKVDFTPSKSRDNSDIYGSYELTSVRHKPKTGTGDVKISIPFYTNLWHQTNKISPFVDFKSSSDAQADPDSFKFGIEWVYPVYVGDNPDERFPFTEVDLINTGKIEAPKNFGNVNAILESKFVFPSSRLLKKVKFLKIYLDPNIGIEIGKNLKSPLKAAEGNGIYRPFFGANLIIQAPIKNVSLLKGFEFESAYTRRFPLSRELTFKNNEDGTKSLISFSKGPKDYSNSKLTFKINDIFGPYIGFEWGSLPPNYNFVDHKWTLGLLFKSKIKIK